MLASKKTTLEDHLIFMLSEREMGIENIMRELIVTKSPHRKESRKALYNTLAKLKKEQVLVYNHGTFALSQPWLKNLETLNTTLQKNAKKIISPASKIKSWSFSDWRTANEFYSTLLLSEVKAQNPQELLVWNPHNWFPLTTNVHEKKLIDLLNLKQTTVKRLLGHDTPLDWWAEEVVDTHLTEVRQVPAWTSLIARTSYIVLPESVLTFRMPPRNAVALDKFFQETPSVRSVNISKFLSVFKEEEVKLDIELVTHKDRVKEYRTLWEAHW